MQVKINKTTSVNPKHTIIVILNNKTLKPTIITTAGKIESDYNLDDTISLLNGEDIIKK